MRRFATDHLSRPTTRALRLLLGACLLGVLLPATVFLLPGAPTALANPTEVSGLVYRDYNDNGVQDAREPGVPDVLVRGFYGAGGSVEVRTAASGAYVLNVPVAAGTDVRVEFEVPSNGFQSGAQGANSGTTVQFATTPAANINLGILRPGQYCQAASDLTLVTSCYSFGNQIGPEPLRPGDPPVLVDFPYEAGRSPRFPNPDAPAAHDLAVPSSLMGSTWGLAYQRRSGSLFVGAFMKRHSGFGPGGPGAIYRVDPTVSPNGAATEWLDLNDLFPGAAGADPRASNGNEYFVDSPSWEQVGKAGLGDIEMFEDDRTLYVIALGDRRLYQLPVGDTGAAPAAVDIRRFDLPDPVTCTRDPATPAGELNLNMRPFGLGVNDGLLYVGMICTAQSTQDSAELQAYVYAFNPASSTFAATPALNFRLDHPRGCLLSGGSCLVTAPGEWRPWLASFNDVTRNGGQGYQNVSAPQPWLTGIEFDNSAMLISLRDRNGDQIGTMAPGPVGDPANLLVGLGGGDIVRACASGAGAWVIQGSTPTCPALQNNNQGPGQAPNAAGEFFYQDNHNYHDETAGGGILQVPGFGEVAQVSNDPVIGPADTHDGGVRWYNSDNGQISWVYRLYNGNVDTIPPAVFGKSNGLGDLEALCNAAPVEIGNRVWYDLDQDGIQGPGEDPIPGVTLRLYDAQGNLLATAITNAEGEYYFRGGPATGDSNPSDHIGLLSGPVGFNTSYQIRIDNPADTAPGGPLFGWYLTDFDSGDSRARDSNGRWSFTSSLVFADVLTGDAGFNNHTYDFGFIQNPTRVRLESFSAERTDAGVSVYWSTGAEIDTWGFHLYRSASGNRADAERVTTQLIPAEGRGRGGASYMWQDATASPGVAYSYWLQEVELNGTTAEYGPVSTTAQPAATRQRYYLPLVRR
jgi:hypothetical protein